MLTLAGCGGGSPRSGSDPLRVVGPWDLGGIEPTKTGAMFSRLQITETLVDADPHGRLLPGLASTWNVSSDGLVWRFRIRDGVLFHDGSRLDAPHAAWALRRAMEAPAALSLAPVDSIGSANDHVVEIRLKRPFAPLAHLLSHTSTQIYAAGAFSLDGKPLKVVGTGPFEMTRFDPPLGLAARAFPRHRSGPPLAGRLEYLTVGRMESRSLVAEGRQADLTYMVDAPSARHVLADLRNRIVAAQMPRTLVLMLNLANPKLADIRVRRAISLAVDRDRIASGLLHDPSLAARQLMPPMLADWHDPSLPPLRHDVSKAGSLLDEAGWTMGADGIRARQGQPLRLQLKSYPDRPEIPILAATVQEQLRQIGIVIDVQIGNSSDIPLSHRDGSLEMAMAARNYANFVDPTVTMVQDFGQTGGDWGATGWKSPRLLTAVDRLLEGRDPANEARREIVRVLHDEMPIIPISWYTERVALGDRISGLVAFDPFERSFGVAKIGLKGGLGR